MATVNDKVRFIERVNAVLNYDNKKGTKRGRGKYKVIGQPERETVYVEKTIVTEDGKGNVISRQVVRSDATERVIEQIKNPKPEEKKKGRKKKASSSQKRRKRK